MIVPPSPAEAVIVYVCGGSGSFTSASIAASRADTCASTCSCSADSSPYTSFASAIASSSAAMDSAVYTSVLAASSSAFAMASASASLLTSGTSVFSSTRTTSNLSSCGAFFAPARNVTAPAPGVSTSHVSTTVCVAVAFSSASTESREPSAIFPSFSVHVMELFVSPLLY